MDADDLHPQQKRVKTRQCELTPERSEAGRQFREEEESLELCSQQYFIEKDGRVELIDWIIFIHDKMKLNCESLWHCVSIIDTFLSTQSLESERFHLLGVATLYLSSKTYENEPVNIRQCVYLTGNCYRQKDIFEMEEMVLQVMSGNNEVYSGLQVLEHTKQSVEIMQKALPATMTGTSEELKYLSHYYAERCIVDSCALIMQHGPELYGAGAVFAARTALETALSAFHASPKLSTRKNSSSNQWSAVDEKENSPNMSSKSTGAVTPSSSPRPPQLTRPRVPSLRLCPSSIWTEDIAIQSGLSPRAVCKVAASISRIMSKDVLISKFPCAYRGSYPQMHVGARTKYQKTAFGCVAELPFCGSMGCSIDEHCSCQACHSGELLG